MTEQRKEFLRKCQFPLTAALTIAPIPQLVYVACAPILVPFFWVLPLVYFLLFVAGFRIPGKRRLLYGIGASVVLAAVGVSMMFCVPDISQNIIACILLPIAPITYIALMMATLPMAGWGTDKELPPFWLYCGFATHLSTYAIKFFLQVIWELDWSAINPCLSITFFGTAILVMMSLTRVNLNNSANGRQKPSDAMQQKNLILTVIFFVLAMLIALIPSIYDAIGQFVSWLGRTIKELIENIQIDDVINDMGDGGKVDMSPVEGGEVYSVIEQLIRLFLNGLFIIIALVCLYLVLKTLVPPIIRFFKKLFSSLRKGLTSYVSAATEDYIDEVTDLTPAAKSRNKVPRLSSAEERSLSPQERIRYRYRRLKARHPEWEEGTTARENLPEKAAPLYEKARYSSHPITEEDADNFKSNTRRV